MPVQLRAAAPRDAAVIADLALALTSEIIERTGMHHFDLDRAATETLCTRLMTTGAYLALLAERDGHAIGYAGMSVGHALYANGTFGTVQEFFVVPGARSAGVGAQLLAAVRAFGRSCGWTRLELCTPPLPEFDRALAFYRRHGFEITGGRKMKVAL